MGEEGMVNAIRFRQIVWIKRLPFLSINVLLPCLGRAMMGLMWMKIR